MWPLAFIARDDSLDGIFLRGYSLPWLGRPNTRTNLPTSKHGHMRELRIQHRDRPLRTLYAFDPGRCAILLIGGDKTGDDRWYEMNVPIADRLYDEHLEQLRREGLKHG
jgi:hypothetical protein